YPPKNHWIYEQDSIGQLWENHIRFGKQPDTRKPRHPLLKVDHSKLQLVIKASENHIVRDAKTNEIVAVVIRDFCGHPGVLEWVDEVLQLEDAGKLAQIGYSAGSRSKPKFSWVKNLLSQALSPEFVEGLDCSSSSAFALFWNMCRSILPPEIISDFNDYLAANNMCRMDTSIQNDSKFGKYAVGAGDNDFYAFHCAEMAPPTGVFACNYARATHNENQPHKYALAMTTGRVGKPGDGGHFYICKYGICIESAANTLVAWIPKHVHGTSLQRRDPNDDAPEFRQTGLAIVTSSRIVRVWKKYLSEEITREE
ncbi:hypothetical protein BV22DRAFT_986498, partial [Leucogyrophana mollusca]